ncbi:hypothetical protein VT84_13935 [Gemmata sp. SH-PL17]|uniref:hypothetical protein n=1 Tax=Gemmata sp. SH-PL17 TaxID=1630693 RepID=UPI00078D1C07|nr:hypothetical protein [Gemmata sp. SH-PL17]AMV25494.1 hypothetical protein VT84_13935 [Gemmata sp. SH-PL17]
MTVPAHVYAAAVRAYTLASTDLFADDEAVRLWARERWPQVDVDNGWPCQVVFWVMSIAAQDGHG